MAQVLSAGLREMRAAAFVLALGAVVRKQVKEIEAHAMIPAEEARIGGER